MLALLNEGRAAGASLPHTHSQLIWLRDEPPAIASERASRGRCPICDMLAAEPAETIVLERDGLVLLCPSAGRAPYELLLAPRACEPDAYGSDALGPALAILGEAIGRLRGVEGEVALNAWLHPGFPARPGAHWHLEVLPRLTVFACLELGAGLYVNPLPPEDGAARLRAAYLSSGAG
jgi:UDPglucose--hexose-1-phosphate uridylyltransferase